MALYLLSRQDEIGYEEYSAKLIRARSPYEARKIANEAPGDEGAIWDDTSLVRCDLIDSSGPGEMILGSYVNG